MGCCVSTNRGSSTEKESHLQLGIEPFHQKPVLESRAPPPSAEEETVKEVWSETPKPKAPIFMIDLSRSRKYNSSTSSKIKINYSHKVK